MNGSSRKSPPEPSSAAAAALLVNNVAEAALLSQFAVESALVIDLVTTLANLGHEVSEPDRDDSGTSRLRRKVAAQLANSTKSMHSMRNSAVGPLKSALAFLGKL